MNEDKYENPERRIDTVAGRNAYWIQLRNLKAEYDRLPADEKGIEGSIPMGYGGGFYTWTRFKYGIEMLYNEEGNIQGDYNVVDQDLYLIFLIKYPA
jgi:hypothetical protein